MYSRILVAIDGSENSIKALRYATKLASFHGANLQVISVIDELKLPFSAQFGLWAKDSHEELFRKMLESLNAEISKIKENNPNLSVDALILEGKPFKKIIEISEEENHDLIVLGARGYGNIQEMVLGSVSNAVVNKSTKPVMIVK